MRRIAHSVIFPLSLFAFLLGLGACQSSQGELPVVTVTIEPLRYFVEGIGGDRLRVETIVPGGSSPESYEPTARQMVDLAGSALYVKVGSLGFERTLGERMRGNAPHLPVADASEGIALVGNDPHTWTSPRNALRMAHNIYRALATVSPGDSAYFRERHDSLCLAIAKLDARIDTMLHDVACRSFVIYHPSLTYFARDYGLQQVALEEEGREPSAAALQRVIDKARREGAKVLFVQREFGGRNTQTVRQATGTRQVEINPLSPDWEREMLKIAQELCTR